MKGGDRRKISRLPIGASAWEAGFVSPREGMVTFGVVDDSGHPRHVKTVAVGEDPLAELADAFLRPPGDARPERPSEVRCAGEEVRRQLAGLVGELVPVVVKPTPMLDRVAERMLERLTPASAPGITAAVGLWRLVLDRFLATAPWKAVGDDVDFRFEGGGLDGTAAFLMGRRGEAFGFAWFPGGIESVELFRMLGAADPQHLLQVRAVLVNVEGGDELDPADRDACDRAGLALSDGRYPWVVATGDGHARGPSPVEQAQALRALAAVVEARVRSPHDPYDGEPRAVEVRTPDGATVRVTTTSEPPELFHSAGYEPGTPPTIGGTVVGRLRTVADALDGVLVRARGEDALDVLGLDGARAVAHLMTLVDDEARSVRADVSGGRIRLRLELEGIVQERVVPCRVG